MNTTTYTDSLLLRLEETDSTNTFLKNQAAQHPNLQEGTTVFTSFQTAGRGQRGNSWESEKGKNLLFSTLLYPHFLEAKEQFLISEITALAIRDTLHECCEGITIKWPNDIYWHDRKICGILIEHNLEGSMVSQSILGAGLNVNQTVFTSPAPNPVSLKQITGQKYDTTGLLRQILQRLGRYYRQLETGEKEQIHRQYLNTLYRQKGFFTYRDKDGTFEAEIADVEPAGMLVLRRPDGSVRKYAFKEVSFIL